MGIFSAAKGVTTPAWDPRFASLDQDATNNTDRWQKLGQISPIQQVNPYWSQQANNASLNQQSAAAQQQQAYNLMQAIANGQATQAQNAITGGYQDQVNGLQSLARSAGGGARGGAAAAQNASMQAGAGQAQMAGALQAQQAQDQINAQRMMATLSDQMRGQDLGALDLTNQKNYADQQFNVDARGLTDQQKLELLRLIQNQKFGEMGFEMDRGRMADDNWWRQNQAERANVRGAIGMGQAAAGYLGHALASDQGGQNTSDPWMGNYSNSPDVVNSDERVKEEVRKQAYEEGLSDARHGFLDIENLLKNAKPTQEQKQQAAKTLQLNVAAPVPAPMPAVVQAPAPPQQLPPEFAGLLGALNQPATVGAPRPAAPPPQLPPQFQGLMGALGGQTVDPTQDRLMSDEDTKASKQPNEEDEFLEALARGRASYKYKDRAYEPNPNGDPGGRYLGVMAQDLERVPGVGRQLVNNTPIGKQVHVPSLVSALAAGTGALYDTQRALDERLARLERKRG